MSDKSNEKDKKILDAAAKCFAINGFSGARVDDIAEEAGVNKATLYYRIGDKAAIYDRIFINTLDTVLESIKENLSAAQSAEDKFRAYSTSIAAMCSSNAHLSPFILREVASGGAHMSEKSLLKMRQVRLILSEILQYGIDQGEFKSANPYLIHVMMIGTLNFYSASQPIRSKMAQHETETSAGLNKPLNMSIDMPLKEVAENISELILNSIRINNN